MALHSSAGKGLYVSFDISQKHALSADVRKGKEGKLTMNRALHLNEI